MGITYPYSRLALVETPVSFSSFSRPNKGGSEMAQPGMLFLPERGIGMWNDNEAILAFRKKVMPDVLAFYRSEEEMISNDLTMSLSSMFLHEYSFHMSQAEMFLYSLVSSSFYGVGRRLVWETCTRSVPCFMNKRWHCIPLSIRRSM